MSSPAAPAAPLPRHDTFQSDETFDVDVYVRGLTPTDVSVEFRERSVTLVVPSATYHIGPLAHEIDPAASSYTVSEFKVELALRKKIAGVQWGRLEGEEASIPMSAPHAREERTPAVDRQTKDWSKICDAELQGDIEIPDVVRSL